MDHTPLVPQLNSESLLPFQDELLGIFQTEPHNMRLTERNQAPAFRLSSSAQVNMAAGAPVRFGKTSWTLVVRCSVRSCIRKGTPSELQP